MARLLTSRQANPAGGLNPAQDPNVGQYGWTNYELSHLNQLIEYVKVAENSSKAALASADFAKRSALYAAKSGAEIMKDRKLVVDSTAIVQDLYNKSVILKDSVDAKSAHVDTAYADFLSKYVDMLKWKDDLQAEIDDLKARVKALEDKP